MAESAGEKSFEPTAHRRQDARDRGQVAFSQDLGSAAMLMLSVLVLMMFGGAVVHLIANLMSRQLGQLDTLSLSQETFANQFLGLTIGLAGVLLPIFGLMMLGGILTNVLANQYAMGLTAIERPVPAAGRGGLVCAHCGFASAHERAFYCPKCGMRLLRG